MADKRTNLERVQERVEENQAYVSYMCEQYQKDAFCWRWRSDYWYNGTHDKFNP